MSSVAHYANHVYMYEVRLKLEFYQAGPETVMSMWVCMQCTGCIILVLSLPACYYIYKIQILPSFFVNRDIGFHECKQQNTEFY